MKTDTRLMVAAGLGLAPAVSAGVAAASSAAFSFTMEKRAVWGNKNKKLHPSTPES